MLLLKAEMLIYCCLAKYIVNLNAKNRSKTLKKSNLFLLAAIAIVMVLSLIFPLLNYRNVSCSKIGEYQLTIYYESVTT